MFYNEIFFNQRYTSTCILAKKMYASCKHVKYVTMPTHVCDSCIVYKVI